MVLDPGLKGSQNDCEEENLHSGQNFTYYINFSLVSERKNN